MGKTPPSLLEIIAVVTRSGNAVAVDRNDSLSHLAVIPRFFQGNAPRRAIGFAARGLEFSSDFDEVVVDALFL
ncbi:hypothetical protein D3C76_1484670 [compost metagenome]